MKAYRSSLWLTLGFIGLNQPMTLLVHGALSIDYCEEQPCVFQMEDFVLQGNGHSCNDVLVDFDFSGDCCSLKDGAILDCALTVVGVCQISRRPLESCFFPGPVEGPNDLYCIKGNAWALYSQAPWSANSTNANTTECPASQYDPLAARARDIRNDFPSNTMVLEGIAGIVVPGDYTSFSQWFSETWQEITERHIILFYEGSDTVRDLILDVLPYPSLESTLVNTTLVTYYVVAWYRGVDGAFRLDDVFREDEVEKYVAALKEAGGPFRALTGVEISNSPLAPPYAKTEVPTPLPTALLDRPTVPISWRQPTANDDPTAPMRLPSMLDRPTVPISWRPPTANDSSVALDAVGSSSSSLSSTMVWLTYFWVLLLVLLGSSIED